MEWEIIEIKIKQGIGEITLRNWLTNKTIIEPCFNTQFLNLMSDNLLNRYSTLEEYRKVHLTVKGKWVTKIHNKHHYKLFCLYFTDPDFGDIYYSYWSPLERLHHLISIGKLQFYLGYKSHHADTTIQHHYKKLGRMQHILPN